MGALVGLEVWRADVGDSSVPSPSEDAVRDFEPVGEGPFLSVEMTVVISVAVEIEALRSPDFDEAVDISVVTTVAVDCRGFTGSWTPFPCVQQLISS